MKISKQTLTTMKKIILLAIFAVIGGAVSAQDIITKTDATEIQAKVVRVGTAEIEYKQWNNLEGPVYTVPVNEVFTIKYENGQRDVMSQLDGGRRSSSSASKSTSFNGKNVYYQGEVALGYSLGLNDVPSYAVFETVHGARIMKYGFAGLGFGLDVYPENWPEVRVINAKKGEIREYKVLAIAVPIFANFKGYYPFSEKCAVYGSVDLGVLVGVYNMSGAGFYTSVGPGIEVGRKSAFDFSIRYQYRGEKAGAMLFRLGVRF